MMGNYGAGGEGVFKSIESGGEVSVLSENAPDGCIAKSLLSSSCLSWRHWLLKRLARHWKVNGGVNKISVKWRTREQATNVSPPKILSSQHLLLLCQGWGPGTCGWWLPRPAWVGAAGESTVHLSWTRCVWWEWWVLCRHGGWVHCSDQISPLRLLVDQVGLYFYS